MKIENERKLNFELTTTNIKQIDPCAIPVKRVLTIGSNYFSPKKCYTPDKFGYIFGSIFLISIDILMKFGGYIGHIMGICLQC